MVEVGGNGDIVMAGGTLDPPNTITIDAGGKISGFGTIGGDITNKGEIDAAGGTLVLSGAVSGSGEAVISGSGVLEFQSTFTDDTSFAAGATGTLRLDQAVPGLAVPASSVSNIQASLALSEFVPFAGIFPTRDPGAFLGEIGIFAGNFSPAGDLANGQTIPISENTALFSLLGTNYGGNGTTTFQLPNLQGVTMIGAGEGPGGIELEGEQSGASTVTLTSANTPPDLGGTSQPFSNYQPSLGVSYIINVSGDFPGGVAADQNVLGTVVPFAGNFAPVGWMLADGESLPIAQYQALFSLVGTTYGGNGLTNFALPNLQGRAIVGVGDGAFVGEDLGQPSVSLSNAQVPDANGNPGTPFDNQQPSLVMNYLISAQGIFPSQDGEALDPNTAYIGEIVAFAGGGGAISSLENTGWLPCDGQLLSINEYAPLFNLLGTTYGGDGVTDFALPNLEDRTVVGQGFNNSSGTDYVLGATYGANSVTLDSAQLPNPPTISGFTVGDTINLSSVAYDPAGSAGLEPGSNNVLQIIENGTPYTLDLDPTLDYVGHDFLLSPDMAAGGTDITVGQVPLTGPVTVPAGETTSDVVVASGGSLTVTAGATATGTTVETGGELKADAGSTITDSVIDYGGVLDLATGAAASGTIQFGPPQGDPIGGTLEIDDTAPLSATITGFADGDTVDLTGINYIGGATAQLLAGNELQLSAGGATYDLQFDPTQSFAGDYFDLAADSGGGTAITVSPLPASADRNFLNALYEDILDRPIDPTALSYYETQLAEGVTNEQIAYEVVTSPEAYQDLVTSWFQQYLERAPDDNGLATFTSELLSGATEEQVQANILGSPEFFQDAGGTDTAFVTALYQDLLGRAPGPGEADSWVEELESHALTPTQVALSFLTSAEHIGDDVSGWFEKFLGRAPTAADSTYYTNLYQGGTTDQTIVATLLGSNEFFEDASTPCYCRGTLIQTARGESPVEDLTIGDKVTTMSGGRGRSNGSAGAAMAAASSWAARISCRSASRPARSTTMCRGAIFGFRRITPCISTAC